MVAALVAGVLWRNAPLQSSRPVAPDKPPALSTPPVRARLWQDPLQAIVDHQTQQHEGRNPKCSDAQHERLATPPGVPGIDYNLLLIPLDGEPYAESVESRLRTRYAVVSALGVAGYEPVEGVATRYVTPPPVPDQIGPDLPFEWYQSSRLDPVHGTGPILVAWVDRGRASHAPLSATRALVEWVPRSLADGR